MIPLSSPHVHTTYCDGQSTASQMAQSAWEKGFVSLGFSSHACQGYDPRYAMSEDGERGYMRDVNALREEYRGRMRIWLGVERDQHAYADRSAYAYIIGSAHYIPAGSRLVAVDGSAAVLREVCKTHYGGDGMALAHAYYEALSAYIPDYKPDIIGHFDLVRKHNRALGFFDEQDPAYLRMAKRAMETVYAGCALLEVNTGGMARAGATEPYPILPLLEHWRELGGRVILASDCHLASQIAFGYEKGLALIRQAGFDRITYLGTGGQLFEEYRLPPA